MTTPVRLSGQRPGRGVVLGVLIGILALVVVAVRLTGEPVRPGTTSVPTTGARTPLPSVPTPTTTPSTAGSSQLPQSCAAPPPDARTVEVTSAADLIRALAAARPGDWIRLAPGRYTGRFESSASGTASAGIVVCGPRTAILDGGGIDAGYGFHLTSDQWTLSGFTITGSQKGVVLDGASHDVLRDLEIFGLGDEGVHFRAFSSDNLLENSVIHDVGLLDPHNGEGVYVGSAKSHWGEFSGGRPDATDRNRIQGNTIGPNTTAESVDIKEGTTGTMLEANTFDGSGMTAADSWVDAKGNDAVIDANTGRNSPLDGFQTHRITKGWGLRNRFTANVVGAGVPGLGFRIDVDAKGNVVTCDNVMGPDPGRLANIPCS
jgi:hypothetical protein